MSTEKCQYFWVFPKVTATNYMEQNKHTIEVQCNCGGKQIINLDQENLNWEVVDSDEREMGVERLHEAVLDYDCAKCDEVVTITLHIWEYPEGFCNMDEILVDGGELVYGCNLDDLVLTDYEDEEES